MSKAGGDGGGGGSSEKPQLPEDRTPEGKVLGKASAAAIGPGWTKVSCPCCESERVEPLVMVKLGEKVRPETKRWLIKLIGAPQKEGGELQEVRPSGGSHAGKVSNVSVVSWKVSAIKHLIAFALTCQRLTENIHANFLSMSYSGKIFITLTEFPFGLIIVSSVGLFPQSFVRIQSDQLKLTGFTECDSDI